MIDRLKRIYPEVALWAAFALASAVFFASTFATPLHPLATGLLMTSVSLLVATTLFELSWQAIVDGRPDAVNPARRGTKAAAQYDLVLGARAETRLRLRLTAQAEVAAQPFADFDAVVDLSEFPFDKHTLPLVLSDRDENVHYKYDAKALAEVELPVMSPDVKLPGWNVSNDLKHQLITQKLPGGGEAQSHAFTIDIQRPRLASFFKTLVPVFFMIFVAGFTLLLKPKSAAGRSGSTKYRRRACRSSSCTPSKVIDISRSPECRVGQTSVITSTPSRSSRVAIPGTPPGSRRWRRSSGKGRSPPPAT